MYHGQVYFLSGDLGTHHLSPKTGSAAWGWDVVDRR